ncbi:MAG: DUF2127 domain-containing protein [Methylacidiphilales bacterium]|nr:DUF2127 domain-containing protein [Candidatus Methylacidiphilales bacterium]
MASHHPLGLRIIAAFKIFKGVLFLGVAWGVFQLIHADLGEVAAFVIKAVRANTEHRIIRSLQEHFVALTPSTLHHVGVGALLYSILLFAEGIGLWLEQHWAEYLVLISCGIFVPAEVDALFRHCDFFHLSVLAINVLILIYMASIVFGKRGRSARH